MESIENKILTSTKKCGRGSVFFASQFLRYGSARSVNKALELLNEKGIIIRIARGVYYYPKQEKVYGLGNVAPMAEDVAAAIARKDETRIVPTGEWAQYQLVLTQQIPMNIVFNTDGTSRTLELNDGRKIKFKHTSAKQFAYKNKTTMLLVSALKSIGNGKVTDEQMSVIRSVLGTEKIDFTQDEHLMPDWIRTILKEQYEKIRFK